MGGLDSAAAAARLVADAYMAAPADVAAAPATAAAAVSPVSYIVWTYFVPTCKDLYGLDLYELVWTRLVLVVVDERNKTLLVYVYQMSVMLIQIHEIIIVIYMKCLGYHIRNQQTKKLNLGPLPCAKTRAHGKGTILCRVQKLLHTAKVGSLPCATSAGHTANPLSRHLCWRPFFCRGPRFAHGKRFAVCPICGTRQRPPLPTPECHVSFAVCGTRQRLCRVYIALCQSTRQMLGLP